MKIVTFKYPIEEYEKYLKILNLNEINFFQNIEWINFLCKNKKIKLYLYVSYKNNEIIALGTYIHSKKVFINLIGNPLSGTYSQFCGIVFRDNISKDLKQAIFFSQLNQIKKKASYIEYATHYNENYLPHKKMKDLGFKFFENKSMIIDLNVDQKILWTKLNSATRNRIRKSIKNDIKIDFISPKINWFDNYYKMVEETFNRQNLFPNHSKSFFLNLESLAIQDRLLCIEAKQKKQVIAAAIFLKDKNNLIFLSSASDDKARKFGTSAHLHWEAMIYGINNKIKNFDFGGMGLEAIDKFKRGFNGIEIFHSKWVKKSFILGLIETIMRFLKKNRLINFKIT